MDTVKVVELIETTLTRRGRGVAPDSPIRIITQYWDENGLVTEIDPAAIQMTPEMHAKIRNAILCHLGETDKTKNLLAAIAIIMTTPNQKPYE